MFGLFKRAVDWKGAEIIFHTICRIVLTENKSVQLSDFLNATETHIVENRLKIADEKLYEICSAYKLVCINDQEGSIQDMFRKMLSAESEDVAVQIMQSIRDSYQSFGFFPSREN